MGPTFEHHLNFCVCFQIPRNREKVAGLHKTVLTTTIHFRNLNRLGRRRTRLLWGSPPASRIFEVGEISAIRSRAFVDRSWHGGWCGLVVEWVGAGAAAGEGFKPVV